MILNFVLYILYIQQTCDKRNIFRTKLFLVNTKIAYYRTIAEIDFENACTLIKVDLETTNTVL